MSGLEPKADDLGSRPLSRLFELAQGGMARVELVLRREGGFERLYAVKRLHAVHREDEYFRAMFLDEARIAGLVHHPHVVAVLDVGEDGDGPFLVMDYIEGVSVADLIRHASDRDLRLPVQLCVRIAAQIAHGLHAAHELRTPEGRPLNLVHRDVSPQNVMIGYDGVARVTDFGIAKALGQSTRTATGTLKGKFGYMSPEQLRYEEPDRRSDLFSLGVLLFELLKGERLYQNVDGMDGVRRILQEAPPDIGEARADVPPEVVELCFALLAKDRDARPPTALDVARRLESVLLELVAAEGPLDVADFVGETFSERRERERARIAAARRKLEEAPAGSASALVVAAGAPRAVSPKGSFAWVMAAVATLAAVAAIATAWTRAPTPPPGTASAAPPVEGVGTPATITLRIDSEPRDAAVRIAGEPRGRTPLDLPLTYGDEPVSVTIELDGYAIVERSVHPRADQTLYVVLTRAPPSVSAQETAPTDRPPPPRPAHPAASAPRSSAPASSSAPPGLFRRFD